MQSLQELFNYIDSTGKAPGEFTKAELFEFGMLHRGLPRSEKSWQAVAQRVGYSNSAAYRKFISRKCNDKQELSETQSGANSSISLLDQPEMFAELYKEKTQIRDLYNAYRGMLREEARQDRFKGELVAAVKALPKLEFAAQPAVLSRSTSEAVLLFSDLHLGVNCANFYNTYNFDVALNRVNLLIDKTIEYCSAFKVSRLNILNLGDLIHGLIHTNARITSEQDVASQLMLAAEILAQMLTKLSKNLTCEICYRSCTDNHSRMSPNKHEHIEIESLAILVDWFLEARLAGSNIKLMHDNIDISLGRFQLLNGKTLMFAHGHHDSLNKCIDKLASGTRSFIDYMCLAHYHEGKERMYGGSRVFVNGSVVGTEDYAFDHRLFSPAEQKLLIIQDNCDIDINIGLQHA